MEKGRKGVVFSARLAQPQPLTRKTEKVERLGTLNFCDLFAFRRRKIQRHKFRRWATAVYAVVLSHLLASGLYGKHSRG